MSLNLKKPVRVRFAPSPTGHLHIGSVRAALFNWLFARHHLGKFLLRIEDTDLERSTQEFTDSILASLEWLGITSDEPIVIQTSLIERHRAFIEQLLSEGKAYKCYCSPEELEGRLAEGEGYDRRCRNCTVPAGDKPYVVRFRLPSDRESITFNDLILGDITVPLSQLDDFIIARSDGSPVYNFVVVVDDATMEISHVIRGQEHINNTPKQILLYEALNLTKPEFAHIPLILGKSGAKLSKRDAATSILSYKEEGYIPEALINYLARLGWSHGNQEIFTVKELFANFSLDEVGKNNAMFDLEKLRWVNSEHIKQKSAQWLFDYITSVLKLDLSEQLADWSGEKVLIAIDLYKERIQILLELVNGIIALSKMPVSYDEAACEKWIAPDTFDILVELTSVLSALPDWNNEVLDSIIKRFAKDHQISLGQIAQPIRIALTGSVTSPGIFHLLDLIGKKESIKRLEALISSIKK